MKKIHLSLSEETRKRLDAWVTAANRDFRDGRVTHSDVVEHVLSGANPDIEQLRREHIDVTKFVIRAARSGVSLPTLIAQLKGLVPKSERKSAKEPSEPEDSE